MKKLSFEEVRKALKGTMERSSSEEYISGVSTDSRKVSPGDLFFAIRGKRFDGHKFVTAALEKGAVGAVVSQEFASPDSKAGASFPDDKALFRVRDTVTALGELAKYYRSVLVTTVVGITGSNGKTTTKEMVYHLLSGSRAACKAEKSFNNFIGLPLTIFKIEPGCDCAVLEMGVSHPGEIRRLAAIARPDIAVILNISEAHLQGLVNILGVALAKAELLDALDERGAAILNKDDPWCEKMASRCRGKVIKFGLSALADVFATHIRATKKGISFMLGGTFPIKVPVIGRHNVYNALAAIAVAKRVGLAQHEIAERFKSFSGPPMRMERSSYKGAEIINDCYNANPRSMECALAEISQMKVKGRKVFVCGDMLELGQFSKGLHRQLGQRIAGSGVDVLFTVGKEARQTAIAASKSGISPGNIFSFSTSEEAAEPLMALVKEGDLVFLKGSRGIRLENALPAAGRDER